MNCKLWKSQMWHKSPCFSDYGEAPTEEILFFCRCFFYWLESWCCLEILSRASCKCMFCQVFLIACCFNSLIRLSKYRPSHSMRGCEMNFSGSFIMTENPISSILLWKRWRIVLSLLSVLISISIWITFLKNFV